jgi:hypothetical protein
MNAEVNPNIVLSQRLPLSPGIRREMTGCDEDALARFIPAQCNEALWIRIGIPDCEREAGTVPLIRQAGQIVARMKRKVQMRFSRIARVPAQADGVSLADTLP